jgi:acyl-CoA reductase-like NAD-dependent aldehyde dehydrogenase
MSNIDKRATELLIENGELVADTLRHLADNEIDSDYFAICHTNENGTEIECELAITDYARQAAGTVDELVNALEAAEKRIAEVESQRRMAFMACNRWADKFREAEKRVAELEVLATSKRPYQMEGGKWGCSVCHKRHHENAVDAALCCAAAGKGEAS